MGRYSYPTRVFANLNAPKKVRVVDDLNEELEITSLSGGYKWVEDKALNDLMHTAVSVSIRIVELPNGSEMNDVLIKLPNGRQHRGRLYGVDKELVPARELTSEELKKAVFGRMKDPSKPKGGDDKTGPDEWIRECQNVKGEELWVKRIYLCTDPSLVASAK